MDQLDHREPRIVFWLGYGGLVPFVVLSSLSAFDVANAALWRGALIGYGAVILSFVGALHWAFAMVQPAMSARLRNACFVWSVVPALLAWIVIVLPTFVIFSQSRLNTFTQSALLVAGFLIHYIQDTRMSVVTKFPPWYLPLRLKLTAVACICLALGALRFT